VEASPRRYPAPGSPPKRFLLSLAPPSSPSSIPRTRSASRSNRRAPARPPAIPRCSIVPRRTGDDVLVDSPHRIAPGSSTDDVRLKFSPPASASSGEQFPRPRRLSNLPDAPGVTRVSCLFALALQFFPSRPQAPVQRRPCSGRRGSSSPPWPPASSGERVCSPRSARVRGAFWWYSRRLPWPERASPVGAAMEFGRRRPTPAGPRGRTN
jgi:hypothetical protein